MQNSDSYTAPRWLPGGNLQTIYSAKITPRARLIYRREHWDTPDGDFIDLDWMDGELPTKNGGQVPLFVLFHGLEGSSQSHYAVAFMAALRALGKTGVIVHFRGCGGEPNAKPRAYHSGDSAEIDWMLRRLKSVYPGAAIFATGISLGGNVLLKWLGERGDDAAELVHGAASVSAPMDLRASGLHLQRGFNMLYTRMFLATLKRKGLHKLTRYPDLFDAAAMHRSRNLYEYDNVVTAPLHGFRDTDDYWARASSKPLLKQIAVPTLIVNALNDPFIPARSLPDASEVSRHVRLEYPATGGHAGFVSGRFPGHLQWLPRRLLAHFNAARHYANDNVANFPATPRIEPATTD